LSKISLNKQQEKLLSEIREISQLIGQTMTLLIIEPSGKIRQKHMENLNKLQARLEVVKKAFSDSLPR